MTTIDVPQLPASGAMIGGRVRSLSCNRDKICRTIPADVSPYKSPALTNEACAPAIMLTASGEDDARPDSPTLPSNGCYFDSLDRSRKRTSSFGAGDPLESQLALLRVTSSFPAVVQSSLTLPSSPRLGKRSINRSSSISCDKDCSSRQFRQQSQFHENAMKVSALNCLQ